MRGDEPPVSGGIQAELVRKWLAGSDSMSCPEDGWDEHAGRHLLKGKFLHPLWLWEVRRNLEEEAAEGDVGHEPLREEQGTGSHETQAGSGEGSWAALLPLGPRCSLWVCRRCSSCGEDPRPCWRSRKSSRTSWMRTATAHELLPWARPCSQPSP